MSDVSNNLVYPTTEWDEIWEKLPNDLKILVGKELIDLNREQKITCNLKTRWFQYLLKIVSIPGL